MVRENITIRGEIHRATITHVVKLAPSNVKTVRFMKKGHYTVKDKDGKKVTKKFARLVKESEYDRLEGAKGVKSEVKTTPQVKKERKPRAPAKPRRKTCEEISAGALSRCRTRRGESGM
jgi:hypothetical protein